MSENQDKFYDNHPLGTYLSRFLLEPINQFEGAETLSEVLKNHFKLKRKGNSGDDSNNNK